MDQDYNHSFGSDMEKENKKIEILERKMTLENLNRLLDEVNQNPLLAVEMES